MNQRQLVAPSDSDSVGGSTQVETGEGEGHGFHSGLEERMMKDPNSSHEGPPHSRASLGTHIPQTHYTRGLVFLCPQVFLLTILLYP